MISIWQMLTWRGIMGNWPISADPFAFQVSIIRLGQDRKPGTLLMAPRIVPQPDHP